MASVAFDTQELVRELKTAGMAQDLADALVRTIVKSHAGRIVTAIPFEPHGENDALRRF